MIDIKGDILNEIGKRLKMVDNPEIITLFSNKHDENEIKKEAKKLRKRGHQVLIVTFADETGLINSDNY